MPPIAELWQEILSWPNNFVLSLLATPTPKHFLTLRISPDIERKLLFLTQHVMFGKQDKYETWFQQRHLATPESQGLRPDLVRYILGAIHPSNEVLRSGSTPRWAVVGGLLTSCTGQVVSAFTKLAIFYDWVAFVPEKDSVMSLEPAALLMQNTVRSHAQVHTHSCLNPNPPCIFIPSDTSQHAGLPVTTWPRLFRGCCAHCREVHPFCLETSPILVSSMLKELANFLCNLEIFYCEGGSSRGLIFSKEET